MLVAWGALNTVACSDGGGGGGDDGGRDGGVVYSILLQAPELTDTMGMVRVMMVMMVVMVVMVVVVKMITVKMKTMTVIVGC